MVAGLTRPGTDILNIILGDEAGWDQVQEGLVISFPGVGGCGSLLFFRIPFGLGALGGSEEISSIRGFLGVG
jgi:hypothetical protein